MISATASIGLKVKQLREKAGLNQAQLADFLGVDQSYISKCEKGERQFSVDQLEKMANLFGAPVAGLLQGELPLETLSFAFRAGGLGNADLVAIAEINRIALNLSQMRRLLDQ